MCPLEYPCSGQIKDEYIRVWNDSVVPEMHPEHQNLTEADPMSSIQAHQIPPSSTRGNETEMQ